jgi:hypothetical protein
VVIPREKLTVVKSVLEATLVYWHSTTHILVGIQKKIKKKVFSFLWIGKRDYDVMAWVNWHGLSKPKTLGGWGLKNTQMFENTLAGKVSGDCSMEKVYGIIS